MIDDDDIITEIKIKSVNSD